MRNRALFRLAAAAALSLLHAAALRAEEPLAVGLRDAVQAAVGSRLDALVAGDKTAAARAREVQTAAALLPQLTATLSEMRTFRVNLAAEGLSFSGFPALLGPYDTFDARVRLTQKLFDWGAARRAQSEEAAARAAVYEEKAAREQVATAAALSYLEAVRSARAVAAVTADKALADQLLALARDRKAQGAATGVDVVRAQARAADASAALLRAQVEQRESLLLLKRVAGWPLERELRLVDDFSAAASTEPALEDSLQAAASGRAELAAAEERARSEGLSAKAARGDRAPSVYFAADYAQSGTLPENARNVGDVGGFVSLPLFTGGQLSGRIDEADARKREALATLADAQQQVELDVRTALERLSESAAEEAAAEESLTLAQRELEMAQDRYAQGVGASVDLVEAQAELARARGAQVSALARYHSSRVNYAAAVGRAGEFKL
jgi:outer membrane protein TolC